VSASNGSYIEVSQTASYSACI